MLKITLMNFRYSIKENEHVRHWFQDRAVLLQISQMLLKATSTLHKAH